MHSPWLALGRYESQSLSHSGITDTLHTVSSFSAARGRGEVRLLEAEPCSASLSTADPLDPWNPPRSALTTTPNSRRAGTTQSEQSNCLAKLHQILDERSILFPLPVNYLIHPNTFSFMALSSFEIYDLGSRRKYSVEYPSHLTLVAQINLFKLLVH